MNKVYYWRDIIGNSDQFHPYHDKIQQLLSGDHKALSLEKLSGSPRQPIYSIRLNLADRLLFTTFQGNICLLEILIGHTYDKSRFLNNPQRLKTHLAGLCVESAAAGASVAISPPLFEAIPAIDGIATSLEPLDRFELHPIDYYHEQWLLFNGEQEKALHAPCPAIVYGPAGSGKSLVAISMLSQYVHEHRANPSAFPVAYISQSPRLVQEMQRLWQASVMDESLHCLVEFKHYDSLLEEDLDKRTLFRSDTLFKVWYGQLLEDVKVPSLTAATTWFELSQCSHYESDAAYIRDGHSLDAIQRTQLRKLYHAYLQQVCVTDALYQEWFVQLLKKHKKPPLSVDEMWFDFILCSLVSNNSDA